MAAALTALSKIKDPTFDLVFCGGTCLSKAYGLLERLSEDIDIKVVLKKGVVMPENKLRPTLSKLKQTVVNALIAEGFDPEPFEETYVVDGRTTKVAIDARDNNTYITFNVRYSSHFDKPGDMRSRLQIELNHRSLSMPKVSRSAESLFDRLRGVDPKSAVKMDCVDLTEAAIEKLISFPRRLAMHMRSIEKNSVDTTKHRLLDPTLVRHIYDIHEINRLAPEAFANHGLLSNLMRDAIKKDAYDFMAQHPELADKPVQELKMAMEEASSNPAIEAAYLRFISVMVYGDQRPDFRAALADFDRLLSIACAPHSELSF
ncbi:MAG: nucleotidyl transferase AbiEii/AbiGii toxin family protein [Betaproteobacteria bacterium]|nr:nucleotidyl transferase AbiEii/AbiGii toxin family protein [Betaproteobacteria bacterium]